MNIVKNKLLTILMTLLLVSSAAFALTTPTAKAASWTHPIPGTTNAGYDDATYNAIQAGMYFTGQVANASATRLLLWNRYHDIMPTKCYIIGAPNPTGVGQTVNFVFFEPQLMPGSSPTGGTPRYAFHYAITNPSGSTTTYPTQSQVLASQTGGGAGIANGDFVTDSTGSTYASFTPDAVGNYTVELFFNGFNDIAAPNYGLRFLWNGTGAGGGSMDYYGTYWPATNSTITLQVQQEPVSPIGYPAFSPIPTAFWTYPINKENTNWYLYTSNWFNNAHDLTYEGGSQNQFQPDGIAPNSGHILWTRVMEDNGLIGGSTGVGRTGTSNGFNAGSQYQPRWGTKIIMHGRLYYSENLYYSGSSELWDEVDLFTGALIRQVNTTSADNAGLSTGPGSPSFGYSISQDNMNQHGIVNPPLLFTSGFNRAYQAPYFLPTSWNASSTVPSGYNLYGPSGETLAYTLFNTNSTTLPFGQTSPSTDPTQSTWYLGQWNSSSWIGTSYNGFHNASTTTGSLGARQGTYFDWNVSIPLKFTTSPTVRAADLGTGILWGSNGSWPTGTGSPSFAYPDTVSVWCISIDPSNRGHVISFQTITIGTTNQNKLIERADAVEGVFVTLNVPECSLSIYDMRTGNLIKTTDEGSALNPYGYYTWPSLISGGAVKSAYGMVYVGGYVGSVSAYNATTGDLVWRHTFPTNSEKLNDYAVFLTLIADNKIYTGSHEHSADEPLFKGNDVRCLNALTGDLIWEEAGWCYPNAIAEADGVITYWNNYDGQVYGIGMGPSSTTVTAPDVGATTAAPITIRGTVMDVSAGTKQTQQAMNFPNGLPAMSDASQSDWMEYVYMNMQKPAHATGVPVTISVLDANNNFRTIGNTTTDSSGMFSLSWTPDIPGAYTVFATFAGSNSYYGSSAETSFVASAPAATAASSATPITGFATTSDLMYIGVAIIVVIIIIGVVLAVLMMRKRT